MSDPTPRPDDSATSAAVSAVVVLAAGEGTRMRSAQPKVLHRAGGRPLVDSVLAAAGALAPGLLVVVVGAGREQVQAHLAGSSPTARTVVQERQGGTGHAVRVALEQLPGLTGTVVVTAGDTPLLRGSTLVALVEGHARAGAAATVLSAVLDDATGYGRVLRDADGGVSGIVEHKDATPAEREVREINSGVYAFDAELLRGALERLSTDNAQGEEYLTDVVGILRADGRLVAAVVADDPLDVAGVNDRVQLAEAEAVLRDRRLLDLMRAGATVVDPRTTWVDADVQVGRDAVLLPGTRLHGRTTVGAGAVVGPDVTLTDTEVGDGARVRCTTADGARIGPGAEVGPYTYLRPGTVLGARAKAGGFVEMKGAVLGEGAKVPHLSYVGDATVGEGANLGAGTIVANYDGVAKHRTEVGPHARVGSDTVLVAPVRVGAGAYVAAGSVITADVPPGALGVARGRQRAVDGWVARRRAGTASDAAARAADDAAARVAGAGQGETGTDGTAAGEGASA
ncbi:bifunctional UDP-N-acetylglucosamine pyrophosphorylase/glucosamine-1-phosphate N-acetyltransferase [Motilibacter rhizosphaerae]|uniref:Bifunctional protein GlmU n=1 Tax=Motilibacter rhizosphaerae TaxID=598652 RepID=A0A4Q7NQ56_9ACTN|nr:bifunctional UDP-N-acetylglucosamine diphosphorylase/glucosamine-1-phosphate N-acetyltransferase GlmU [Motilibacter rhizosphaerae]RZS87419.1 bifunctional UDP-N-acetylglucosamine pyrophosphorylase/glucosamine-1-phosphate N-acetyltransferase [Motilibacter rhizosphaerae]